MYILKNAWVSITRNKGRNILIGIIVLVIASASAITLSIKNSATTLVEAYSSSTSITASLTMDRNKLMGGFDPSSESMEDKRDVFNNIPQLTIDEINSYGDSSYVSNYFYTSTTNMNSSNIEKATSGTSEAPSFGGKGNNGMNEASFTVTGYSSYDAMSEFLSGTYAIIDGEVSDDFTSSTCVINSELATVNSLSVGDTITLTSPNDENITYNLTITGIFSDNDTESAGMSMFSNSVNTIITNSNVISNISSLDSELKTTITPTFILTDSSVIDAFSSELTTEGLSEYYSVTTNLDAIESETKAITNLSNYATTFLIIILIVGGAVLFVINMINVRERKYEIGVLRTMGMKKSTVILQFVIELMIVSVASLVIGCGIGSILSVPTANKLLEQEITSSEAQTEKLNNNFGKGDRGGAMNMRNHGITVVNKITSINAVVDVTVLLELLGIGIVLTLISSSSAMISISRFSPLTILKERS